VVERKPKPSRYVTGQESVEQILRAAENVLVEKGHAALTLRRISEECGLKVGNLSYYFPTKNQLVMALIDSLMDIYQGGLAQTDREIRDAADAEALLTELMFFWMRDNETYRTSRIFIELWSMANNDPQIREAVNRMYVRGHARFRRLLHVINPALSEDEMAAISVFAISLLEGLMVFANKERPAAAHMPLLAGHAVSAVLQVANKKDAARQQALTTRWRDADRVSRAK
jgi:AcrR family transcriptional regulator